MIGRIVIITGTITPCISARSFRSTELACGLAKLGYDVTVYAILGSNDYTSFEKEHHLKVKDLGKSRFGNIDSDGKENMTFINRVLRRMLYNVIDYPRCEFFFKAYFALKSESPFDLLITIAHPFGIHWGAAYFKKKHPGLFNKWISDCGDPFMGNPVETKRWHLFLEPLERFWCKQTDLIAIPVAEGINGYFKDYHKKIIVIPQGIDFSSIELDKYTPNDVPTFIYSGTVYRGVRDPREFLEYLVTLDIDFKFYVFSPFDTVFGDYKERLCDKLIINRYIPRKDLIKIMSRMDFLINLNNNSVVQVPSKLIDYSLSKRPILNVSTHFTDQEREAFDSFICGDYSSQYVVPDIDRFDSKNVCKSFIDAGNSIS